MATRLNHAGLRDYVDYVEQCEKLSLAVSVKDEIAQLIGRWVERVGLDMREGKNKRKVAHEVRKKVSAAGAMTGQRKPPTDIDEYRADLELAESVVKRLRERFDKVAKR